MASRESRSAAIDNVPANKRRRKDQCEGSATLDASTDVQGSTVSPPRSALNAAPSTPTPLFSSPRPVPSCNAPASKRRRMDHYRVSASFDATTNVQCSTENYPRSALNQEPSHPQPAPSSSSVPSPPSVSGRLINEHALTIAGIHISSCAYVLATHVLRVMLGVEEQTHQ